MAVAPSAGLSSHVVALVSDMMKAQHDAHADAVAVCATAAAPKTVSEHFNTHNTAQLMFLTQEASEANQPKIWLCIAKENGKCEPETIEILFHEAAANTGNMDQSRQSHLI